MGAFSSNAFDTGAFSELAFDLAEPPEASPNYKYVNRVNAVASRTAVNAKSSGTRVNSGIIGTRVK